MTGERRIQRIVVIGAVLLAVAVAITFFYYGRDYGRLFVDALQLSLTGVLGGLFGSGGGTGDGGIYMPALRSLWSRGVGGAGFNGALLDGARIAATSLALQAFGLAAGALAWLHWHPGAGGRAGTAAKPGALLAIVLPVIAAAVPAYAISARGDLFVSYRSEILFRLPIILIVAGLLIAGLAIRTPRPPAMRTAPSQLDTYVLFALGIAGGISMALVSVGLGAAVVIYLLARGFPAWLAASSATLASLLVAAVGTVASFNGPDIAWPIVMAALPGAIAGGLLLRGALASIEPRFLVALSAVVMAVAGTYQTLA